MYPTVMLTNELISIMIETLTTSMVNLLNLLMMDIKSMPKSKPAKATDKAIIKTIYGIWSMF